MNVSTRAASSNAQSVGQPLRIGLLAPASGEFAKWELRLFEHLVNDPRFEIAALIVDGRPTPPRVTLKDKLLQKSLPRRILQKFVNNLDRRGLSREPGKASPRLQAALQNAKTIAVNPERRRFVDLFTTEDSERIRALDLDVLLRHEFGIIKGPVLQAARHGIWSFHHADNRVNRGGPPGFWETLNNAPVTGATLQVLTPELDGGHVIARCWRTTLPNAARNQQAIFELSVSLIWRELQRLARDGKIETKPSELYDGPLFVTPGTRDLLRYCTKRVRNMANGAMYQWRKKRRLRPNMWCLALGRGDIQTASLWRTKEIPTPDNMFWADPFLFEKEKKTYVFFEEYDYSIERAWISFGLLEDGIFTYQGKAIDAGYHMSFPFIYEHEGETYLIPETTSKNRLEIWRATSFPSDWTLAATKLEGANIADPVLHHHEGQWYLLANVCQTDDHDYCNELHVFMVDGPLLNEITPHPQNPVVIDSRTARNGGRMFTRDGRLFRPSQNNSYGVYGYGLNIMEVLELSPTNYRETVHRKAEPNFRKDVVALHHVDTLGDLFVMDMVRKVGGKGDAITPVTTKLSTSGVSRGFEPQTTAEAAAIARPTTSPSTV